MLWLVFWRLRIGRTPQYAVYSMILAVQCPSDDDVSMALVMGYMGGVCVVLFL